MAPPHDDTNNEKADTGKDGPSMPSPKAIDDTAADSGDEHEVFTGGAETDDDEEDDDKVGTTPPVARSVLDFEGRRSLRDALRDFSKRGSVCSTNSCPFYDSDDDEEMDDDGGRAVIGGMDSFGRAVDLVDPVKTDWVTENMKMNTSLHQTLDEETERLLVLKSYLMLDSDREPAFERLTALAQRFFDVPIALISLIDIGRQWFMSNRGLGEVRETPRKLAFCAHAIQSTDDMLIVSDAKLDPRFRNNGLVTGPPHIRFYAGAPLICPEGYKLGTLCMIDRKPRPDGLSLGEKQTLLELAALVMEAMVHRRRDRMDLANDRSRVVACLARDLMTPLRVAQKSLASVQSEQQRQQQKEEEEEDSKPKPKPKVDAEEAISSASMCLDVMEKICDETVRTFRSDLSEQTEKKRLPPISPSTSMDNEDDANRAEGTADGDDESSPQSAAAAGTGPSVVTVSRLVSSLRSVIAQACPDSAPITIAVEQSVPTDFMSDGLKLFRSALNLLINAASHTKMVDGGSSSSIRFRIYAKKMSTAGNKAVLMFECEDTGTGVSSENRKRLFLPFPRGGESGGEDPSQDDDEEGEGSKNDSGLGLYSVAVNISSLGGRYGYRPRAGWDNNEDHQPSSSGSIFWFSVPLVVCYSTVLQAKEDAMDQKSSAASASASASSSLYGGSSPASSSRKKKMLSCAASGDYDSNVVFDAVAKAMETKDADAEDKTAPKQPPINRADQPTKYALVIDDSIVIRKAIGRALTKLGFEVKYAIDGMQGLTALQSAKFDVVFCDFLMPVLDGLDCIEQYRSWESDNRPEYHQKIVGLSAHASDADVKRGESVGMDSFVSKNSKLQDALQKAIDSSENFKVGGNNKRGGGGPGLGPGAGLGAGLGAGFGGKAGLSSSLLNVPMTRLQAHPSYSPLMRSGRPPVAFPSVGSSKQAGLSASGLSKNTLTALAAQTRTGAFSGGSQPGSGSATGARSCIPNDKPPDLECLIVEDSRSALKILVSAVESSGWKATVADDEEHALTLLKSKRWGGALIDGEGAPLVAQFRVWESKNRTTRQNNIYLMQGKCAAENGTGSAPSGFDGTVCKPIKSDDISKVLEKAALRRFDREEIDK